MHQTAQDVATSPLPVFMVSTDALPERDRVPFFREELAKVLNCDLTPLSERAPRHAMDYVVAGPIGLSRLEGSPSRYVRTRRHLADCDDDFTLGFFTGGWETMTHNGRTTTYNTGDAYLIHNGRPLDAHIPDGANVTAIRVDADALRALVKNPEDIAGEGIVVSRPGVALLRGYVDAFSGNRNGLTPALLRTFGLHVIDLVATILGARRDGAAAAEAGGVRAARLRKVLSAIATNADDPGFGLVPLAAELAVTPRYIHRLLEETGLTFYEHLLEARLGHAWRLLSSPLGGDMKIAAIAYDCGFNDLSHFNRAFRRRFGETPSSVRGTQGGDAPSSSRQAPSLAAELAAA